MAKDSRVESLTESKRNVFNALLKLHTLGAVPSFSWKKFGMGKPEMVERNPKDYRHDKRRRSVIVIWSETDQVRMTMESSWRHHRGDDPGSTWKITVLEIDQGTGDFCGGKQVVRSLRLSDEDSVAFFLGLVDAPKHTHPFFG